jgi:hypothetical protein
MNKLAIIKVMDLFVPILSDIIILILENLDNCTLMAYIIEINQLHADILIMTEIINRAIV